VRNPLRKPAAWVFLILLGSNAYFWHTRDWNTASRLMLTYALVDRGTVIITGLENQTGDKAKFQGEYYSDKLPGFSLLAAIPYAVSKLVFGIPSHPLREELARQYWAADYWVTLFTSGLVTACTGALLVYWSRCLGCGSGRAALLGLSYGLATPAFVYATLAYGHQVSAFALFTAFFLLWKRWPRRRPVLIFIAGFLAAYAAVVDLYVGPVSAIMGFYLLAQCIRRERRLDDLALFGIGAAVPTLILLGYNQLAFGSPIEMGYFHHATQQFAEVHSSTNPLGLVAPESFGTRLLQLLWGRNRGLTSYAPIVLLTLPGWLMLIGRRQFSVAAITFLVVLCVFLVNMFYPEWTGGWSTGPRLLVPLLPFAILPIAGLLAGEGRISRFASWLALGLALAGGIEMFVLQAAGGRYPQEIGDPLIEAALPIWSGEPIPWWRFNERFSRNPIVVAFPGRVGRLQLPWQGLQFLPLLVAQGIGFLGLWFYGLDRPGRAPPLRTDGRTSAEPSPAQPPSSNLGIDQK